jgi:uncharacterized membrane protein YqiK
MFTIPTLPKILLIVLVIGVIWWWHRRNQIKKREQAELERNPYSRAKAKPAKPIEDMTQCKACGAYVPASGAKNCGRANCPF